MYDLIFSISSLQEETNPNNEQYNSNNANTYPFKVKCKDQYKEMTKYEIYLQFYPRLLSGYGP